MRQQHLEAEVAQLRDENARLRTIIADAGKMNGWQNHETWQVNLWFGDYFSDGDKDASPEAIEAFVREHIDSQVDLDGTFLGDVVGSALGSVRWHELSEHYKQENEEDE